MEDKLRELVQQQAQSKFDESELWKNQRLTIVHALEEVLKVGIHHLDVELFLVLERFLLPDHNLQGFQKLFQALVHLENREGFKDVLKRLKDLHPGCVKEGDIEIAAFMDRVEMVKKMKKLSHHNKSYKTAVKIVCAMLDSRSKPCLIRFDELKLEGYIGQGRSGAVFEGIWLDHPVVVKFLGRGDGWRSIEPPSWTLTKLKHPNLLSVLGYSSEEEREQHVVVMEKARGLNLARFLSAHQLEDAISVLIQVAAALEFLHSRDVIHMGLKPRNIFVIRHVEDYHSVQIGDFGLGMKYWDPDSADRIRNSEDEVFMAPEVRPFGSPYTKHADVYSFGVICYSILTGRFKSKIEELWRQRWRTPSFDDAAFADYPTFMVELLKKCLSSSLVERPSFSTITDTLKRLRNRGASSCPPAPSTLILQVPNKNSSPMDSSPVPHLTPPHSPNLPHTTTASSTPALTPSTTPVVSLGGPFSLDQSEQTSSLEQKRIPKNLYSVQCETRKSLNLTPTKQGTNHGYSWRDYLSKFTKS